jgi:hypothetical protein
LCGVDATQPSAVLEKIGGGIVVDLLTTHPKLMLGEMVLENPHDLSPDGFLATR